MDDAGEIREDLKLPEGEVGDELRKKFESGDTLLVSIFLYTIFY